MGRGRLKSIVLALVLATAASDVDAQSRISDLTAATPPLPVGSLFEVSIPSGGTGYVTRSARLDNLSFTLGSTAITLGTTVTSLAGVTFTGASTWNGSVVGVGYGGTGQVTYTNGQLLIGNAGSLTKGVISPPAAGITVGLGPGTITLGLANDLGAVEAMTGTGLVIRTGTDTWNARTLTGTASRISVTNGGGIAGNPTIDIAAAYVGQSTITTLGTVTTGTWNASLIGVQYGGTGANLSATGGASQVLKQVSTGAAITVGQLAASDLSNSTTGSGTVVLATSPTLVTPVLGAATGTSISLSNTIRILNATAIPAGGATGEGYKFSSSTLFGVFFGSGAPTLTGDQGSLYLRSDGSGADDRAYINTDGTTGWTPVVTGTLGTGVASFLGTPSSANLATAVTNETGSGALVFATSPTLGGTIAGAYTLGGTPTLGAALTLPDSGEISSSGWLGIGNAPAAKIDFGGNVSAAFWSTNGIGLRVRAATLTDTSSSGSVSAIAVHSIGTPTLAASSATTYSSAATLRINAAPVAGTNVTITNSLALHVAAGTTRLDGSLSIGSSLTLSNSELGITKITASGTAPGASGGKIALVCGTNAGTAKLIAYAGTSTTATAILDNVGSGVSGC